MWIKLRHVEVNFRVERGIKGPKAVEVEVVEPGTKDWSIWSNGVS